MAFQRHAQLALVALRQPRHIALGLLDFRQQGIGQPQQACAGRGKADRYRFALKKRPAVAIFQQFDLVGERRLGQVKQLGGADQAAGGAQCGKRAQMTDFKHRNGLKMNDFHIDPQNLSFLL